MLPRFLIVFTALGMAMFLPAPGAAFARSAVPMACAIAVLGLAAAGAERGLVGCSAGTG